MSERVYDEDVTEISARVGESFVVALKGQPTAGYVWDVGFQNGDDIECAELDFRDADRSVGGSDGQRFRVTPRSAGAATIELRYGRPWESEPQERRSVTLNVSDDTA